MQKIMIAVRSEPERHGWHHPMLTGWLLNLMTDYRYEIRIELVHGFSGYAAPANRATTLFLEHSDCDWLGIVDNDVVPPPNLIEIVDALPLDVGIISPVCHMSREDSVHPQAGVYKATGEFKPLDGAPGRYEVDRVGGGCWFIRRSVFDKLEKPYFRMILDPATYGVTQTDDLYFQESVRKVGGIRMVCDSRFVCSHLHTVDLSLELTRSGVSGSRKK
jgi:hypothetical protein